MSVASDVADLHRVDVQLTVHDTNKKKSSDVRLRRVWPKTRTVVPLSCRIFLSSLRPVSSAPGPEVCCN